MFSTRMNVGRLLDGQTVFESQHPDVTGPEMSIQEIGAEVLMFSESPETVHS